MNDTTKQPSELNPAQASELSERVWESEILPVLEPYIEIPNKSPDFDPDWQAAGHMDRAVTLIADWCRERPVPGLSLEVVRLEGRTPLILMEVPATSNEAADGDTVVLYGHLDKQPEMVGWRDGLGPWKAVREGDRLYGRGGADDGYAAFASLTALQILAEQGIGHARCVILIEACEESGSYDLPYYIDHLAERIGTPSLVVCLDSGCGDYERLWSTTSLRGMAAGDLVVEILGEGVHSGDASGIVPDSFRILRAVLDRLEDQASGQVKPAALHVEIPEARVEQARAAAEILGDAVFTKFPFVEGASPLLSDRTELVLNRTWRPTVTVTGTDGLPAIGNAGNVLRPKTAAKLSLRLPPTLESEHAVEVVREVLESDPPYGAQVRFENAGGATGWDAPAVQRWLLDAVNAASETFFGSPAAHMGEGGTIPFMGMLGDKFPEAQFLITGVLGPESNAHGPNEYLHVPTAKRLTACVAKVLEHHAQR